MRIRSRRFPRTALPFIRRMTPARRSGKKASEHCRRRTYATQPGVSADLTAEVMTLGGTTEVRIHAAEGSAMTRLDIGGAHNGHNAAAAAAAAFSAGVKFDAVIQGLQAFKPVARRGVRHQLRPELLLIDDTYNANPDSMRAGIDVLTSSRGPLVLIAGDMGEVEPGELSSIRKSASTRRRRAWVRSSPAET